MKCPCGWLLVALSLAIGILAGPILAKPNPVPIKKDTSFQVLQEMVETREFQNPTTLKDFLALLESKIEAREKTLPIYVDVGAFRDCFPDHPMVLESLVQIPAFPRRMTVANILRTALGQVGDMEPVILHRGGQVEITPKKAATRDILFNQTITAVFDQTPLREAMSELADATGVSITLDVRAKDSAKFGVTAKFRNDVAVQDVVRMLAEMADLKVVLLPTSMFVTTPDHAKKLQKELRDLYDPPAQEPNAPGAPGGAPPAPSPLAPPLPPPPRGGAQAAAASVGS